jgi:4-hydroxy-tetrahydrodipicolinate synthase
MNWTGCFTALVTPFNKDGKIDENGFASNIEWLIKKKVAGIIPCGTTGESPTLAWDEHKRLIEIAVATSSGRVPVIAGAGSNSTEEAMNLAKHAEKSNADAVLCIVPYYNKPTQEGMYQHFKAIAANINIPVFLYNLPGRCVVNMLPETVERLSEIDNIVGLKEGNSDMVHVSEIHRRCGERLTILSGDDLTTLPMLAVGAKGVISVAGNIIPDKMGQMISSFMDGNIKEAIKIHEEYLSFFQALFFETNPIPVKAAMNHLGLAAGGLRLPLVPMSEAYLAKLLKAMQQVGINKNL